MKRKKITDFWIHVKTKILLLVTSTHWFCGTMEVERGEWKVMMVSKLLAAPVAEPLGWERSVCRSWGVGIRVRRGQRPELGRGSLQSPPKGGGDGCLTLPLSSSQSFLLPFWNTLVHTLTSMTFRVFSHIGYYRAWSRVSCATQQVLMLSVSHSLVPDSATPWTAAHQVLLSRGFSRQGYWSGLLFPSPGDLPNPGIKPGSPALQADSLPTEPPGKPS